MTNDETERLADERLRARAEGVLAGPGAPAAMVGTIEQIRHELEVDQIELQIRDSWRTLEQAKRSYEISEIGVRLAERRVEEQELLAEFGRAKALDQVDAENALLSSKDQRTQALVAHTIARLQFWDNMGILYIKENGQWENFDNAKIR